MYSMTVFSDLIFPVLEFAQANQVVEIGADTGGMSLMLAEFCFNRGGRLTSIDPAPTPAFRTWATFNPQVHHIDLPSLEALPKLTNIDAWIIDGDHNWYTVYNEITEAGENLPARQQTATGIFPRCMLALRPPRYVLCARTHSGRIPASLFKREWRYAWKCDAAFKPGISRRQ